MSCIDILIFILLLHVRPFDYAQDDRMITTLHYAHPLVICVPFTAIVAAEMITHFSKKDDISINLDCK